MGNNTSTSCPSKRLIRELRKISPSQIDGAIMAALQDNPAKQVEYILRSDSTMNRYYDPLTEEHVALAVSDCFNRISTGPLEDDMYVYVVIEGVVSLVDRVGSRNNDGEALQLGMEQLLRLASRSIKGEACQKCGDMDYQCPNRLDQDVHDFFAGMMGHLVKVGKRAGIEWSLGRRGRFSLNQLCAVYDIYKPLQHLAQDINPAGKSTDYSQLEEMWCHEGCQGDRRLSHKFDDCGCWDVGSAEWHCEGCPMQW